MKKEKLINFKKDVDFRKDLQAGELMETSIIFVDDTKKIYTHGTEFDCSGGGSSVNADWDAQKGEVGYIKNRPFGYEYELWLDVNNISTSTVSGNGYGAAIIKLTNPTDTSCLYRVEIGDKVYNNIEPKNNYLSDDYTGSAVPLYPNSNFIFMGFYNNNYNQLQLFTKEPLDNVSIRIYKLSIKIIDNEFLPNQVYTSGDGENSIIQTNEANIALGKSAIAEGFQCKANRDYSHAEGWMCETNEIISHAEGNWNTTNGKYSHAEGNYCETNGDASHAEGYRTVTYNIAEHSNGHYNISIKGDEQKADNVFYGSTKATLFSIGNGNNYDGKAPIRHNAFEVKQNGDIYIPNTNAEGECWEKPMLKIQDNLFFSWVGSQEDYDLIEDKDPNTFYFIKED